MLHGKTVMLVVLITSFASDLTKCGWRLSLRLIKVAQDDVAVL